MNEFPRRFGPYVLLKPLARGGMGALYLALRGPEDSAKLCVIKTVLPHLADKEYLQRFRDEAKVVVRLSHGNLVPVFDSGLVGGEIYLAMDFVEGKDLRATWNRCAKKGIAFPVDVAAHIVKELARGLHYAHSFGDIKLVHRDVSPPNVLLSYSGEVRLTDFGLASSTLKLEKTAPGIIYGKVSYMSPEQARGETLDGRTDLYASGIILWELLTGRQLFPSGKAPGAAKDAQTAEELLRRVRNPELVAPSRRAGRVPLELDRIALKALAPDIRQRYASCEELRHDLASFLAQTSPGTDASRLHAFLADLYGEDIAAERAEREGLILKARDWYSTRIASPSPPPAPVSPPPLSAKAGDPERITEPDPKPGVTERSGRVGRSERGTMVSGPARHDHGLDKRRPETEPLDASDGSEETTAESGPRSTAVVGSVVGGRYFIRKLCGEGGMGRVYEAEHIDIGKRVALKILHPAYSQTPDLVERLRREARAASKISHPNVVDVTDSGTTPDGAFFFVMEYLEGIELGELIYRENRLDVLRTLHIGAQICRALQAAHEVNVIHRDLKPENVLILRRNGQNDFVKVLDFGIAKSGTDDLEKSQNGGGRRLTHPGMTMGTPEYMAPEQAAGHPADPRSDVYAMGGLLYEMLSGKAPFEGANFMEILHKKANSMPAPLSGIRNDVPAPLEALIMKALAKDPNDRPPSMEVLAQELTAMGTAMFPGFGAPIVSESDKLRVSQFGMMGSLRGAAAATGLYDRIRKLGRTQLIAAAGVAGLAITLIIVGVTSGGKARSETAAVKPPAVGEPAVKMQPVLPPEPVPVVTTSTTEKADEEAASEAEGEGEGESAEATAKRPDGETTAKPKSTRAVPPPVAVPAAPDTKKMLADGERLLRAERFGEAREIFEKLAKSRKDRGPALLGLAEISFQEKKYAEAVHAAERAAEKGGGVKARVLLGDAHFRLSHYKEAAKAYQDALKIDPNNASAKSGLALATKRM
jgi:serine/threonine protein kinase/Flp pilus assembly protein TadD